MTIAPLLLALAPDVPKGFAPTEQLAVFRRNPNDIDAPNWELSVVGDRIVAETAVAHNRRQTRQDAMRRRDPRAVEINLGMSRPRVVPSQGLAVPEGWLHAFDRGEFGGGIYLFPRKGGKPTRVSGDNTSKIVATPKGIFAIQAFAHLVFWFARLVRVEKGPSGWKTRAVTDLHEAPHAALWDGGRFLLAMGEYVTTLSLDGTQREIYRGLGRFRTESMVRRPNGEVWIGSSHGLLRLQPKSDGKFASQWYLPLK